MNVMTQASQLQACSGQPEDEADFRQTILDLVGECARRAHEP